MPDKTGTYHGIIKATCLGCHYNTIDDTTLEAWNDAPMLGLCPNCNADTGQTQWVTLDGRVLILSFVEGQVIAETNVTGDAAFWIRSRALCDRVAALIPGASTGDDGGGEYVTLDRLPLELFPVAPENATTPEQAGRWHLQINYDDAPQVIETSDLTIDSDPADVAAWALTLIPQPKPADPWSGIHELRDSTVTRLAQMLTAAATDGKRVLVTWNGGLMVKVGGGIWTEPLGEQI